MRILVTGASGWIGSAVVPELLAAGHQVVGLARSDAAADVIAAGGAEVVRGSLADLDGLRAAAASVDGVVHLAFDHATAFGGGFVEAAQGDRRAVDALGEGLAGSGGDRPFVVASGVAGLAAGRVATEDDRPDPDGPAAVRIATGDAALALAARGVRPVVVRFAPTVHGPGDTGFVASLARTARERGASGYVGDGSNRWPAVHRLDAARLVARAVAAAPAGSVLHATAEEGVALRDVATVIGRQLGVPVVSVDPADASEHFGWLGMFVGVDTPASSAVTQARTGWEPVHPGLLADLEAGHYPG